MNGKIKLISLLFAAVLLLTGCSMRTVDQMYAMPKRPDDYNDLQSVIDSTMEGLEYCAPLAGENQQTVQMADLDGDGLQEYLLFAKGTEQLPLKILIFRSQDGTYVHADTIESNGTAFDQVEYVQMDDMDGLEIIVGRQVSDQVLRSVSVYTFARGTAEQMLSVNYTKFMTIDMDADDYSELFILRPGQTDTDNGVAELYGMEKGAMERSNEVNMSRPADQLKRIISGRLHDGEPAVYVASAVGDAAIITDVYAEVDGMLANVTFSNESGTSIQTMRNYYVYADDIDNDGVVELPDPINMKTVDEPGSTDRHELLRWYAMTASGGEVNKMYTYHNFVGGWYMELESRWAPRLAVRNLGYQYEFYLWDEDYGNPEKIMTVYILTGQNREEQAAEKDRFVLLRTDSVIYAASLSEGASTYGLSWDDVVDSFHLIQQDWKTGET